MRLIGLRCKYGDIFSLQVLIGRGLDLLGFLFITLISLYTLFGFQGFALIFKCAPLAQLVEQLTLNQWVQSSNL